MLNMVNKTKKRNDYHKEYRKKNPRKIIEAQLKYWNKKLEELEQEEAKKKKDE